MEKYKLAIKTEFAEVVSTGTYTMNGVLNLIKTYGLLFGDTTVKEYKIIAVENEKEVQ